MEFLSDLLLAAATIGAAAYCVVLSRRLKALGSLEGGMGSAIALLSTQVDDLSRSLNAAREASGKTGARLDAQAARAEAVARKLELLVASMHDLPDGPPRDPGDDGSPQPPLGSAVSGSKPALFRSTGLRSARPPSPWPASAGRRAPLNQPSDPEDDAHPDSGEKASAPSRGRVLRRRPSAQTAESR